MAETTYNLTIPHTSPNIYYDNTFSTECPSTDSNGFPVCDNATGFHVTANSSATMRFQFVGRAIYVYGSVDEGMQYTWSLDYGTNTAGKPNGNVLIAAENLQLRPFMSSFMLEIDISQFKSGARFQFSKADVVAGTGMTGAKTFVDSYQPGNTSLQLTTGWTANDTITGYHYYQGNSPSVQTAILGFQGAIVWVWGFCGPRGQFVGGEYGVVSVDGGFKTFLITSSTNDRAIDHKCLIYWQSGLNVTQQHNITYNSDSFNVLIESFEVLRVEGGAKYKSLTSSTQGLLLSMPTSLPSTPTFTTPETSTASVDSNYSTRVAIAATFGVIGGLVSLGTIILAVQKSRKKRQQKEKVSVAMRDQVAVPGPNQSRSSPSPPAPTLRSIEYHSTSATSPQRHDDDRATQEVNRLRQEMNAMVRAMHEQQQNQLNVPTHGEDGGWVPPPAYQPIAPSA